ncbi:MAG: L,D-transpeptidase family protein, partial [Chthoniobacteraceae bacterium]
MLVPHSVLRLFSLISAAVLALIGAGCSSYDPRFDDNTQYLGGFHGNDNQGRAPHDDVSYWDGDGVPGSSSIAINLSEQRAYFYKGGELVGISVISSGREEYGTPTGNYKITQKDLNHTSSLYGNYVDAQTGEVVVADVDTRKDKRPPGTRY